MQFCNGRGQNRRRRLEPGIMVRLKQVLAVALVFGIVLATSPVSAQDAQQQPANLSPSDIDALVAPIALYPDALVAQVLAAATYPNEVVEAAQWLKDNSSLQGQALADAVNQQQQWDPSVQALTQFPSVLDNMASNLSWTSALGSAFYNQQADVMASVQRLRAQAKAAGNLKSSSQMTVVQQDPQTIVIQPANPQVVYVPVYNPTVVYGTPYYPPYYSTGALVATGLISFGVGFAIGAAMSGGCCGWGWNNWNSNWRGGTVVYNRNVYVSHSNIYAGGNRYHNGSWARPVPYNNNYNRNNYYNNNNRNVNNNRNTNISGNTVNINNGNRTNNNVNNGNRNNNVNNGNRPTTMPANNQANRPQNTPANRPQSTAAKPANNYRGYGQTPSPGTKTGAFSGYSNGGAARTESSRGSQSFGGGGGNRGGGGARGGGGRR
jgi:uncharacterized membrane protein YgcG